MKPVLLRFGEKFFLCELKTVKVKSGKTTEKVFCRQLRSKDKLKSIWADA